MCRGMLGRAQALSDEVPVTRELLAEMMMPLADAAGRRGTGEGACSPALQAAVGCQFLALKEGGDFAPEGLVTRQEMATVRGELPECLQHYAGVRRRGESK